jgi:hypothetical protein
MQTGELNYARPNATPLFPGTLERSGGLLVMNSDDGADDVLDMKGAAALLKLHVVTLGRLAPKLGLGRKIGRRWRFSRAKLIAYVEGGEQPIKGEPFSPPAVRSAVQRMADELSSLLSQRDPDWAAIDRLTEEMRAAHFGAGTGPAATPLPRLPRRKRNPQLR